MFSSTSSFDKQSIRIIRCFLFLDRHAQDFKKCILPRAVSTSTMTIAFAMLFRWNRHTWTPHKINISTPHSTVETSVLSYKNSAQRPRRLRRINVLGARCFRVSQNGNVSHSYPFLTNRSNWIDIMFVQAPHGKGPTSAWESTAHYLSKAVDPNGNIIFPLLGCNDRQLKSRFQGLMTVMKKIENNVLFKSGCHNEVDP